MVISSIDIGTNTVLLLVAETDPKNNKIIPLLNEYRIPRIGKNICSTGLITSESSAKLRDILLEYKYLSESYKSELILATATAGFRKAKNSEEIINTIFAATGLRITVVSGQEEALLAYLGVSDGNADNNLKLIVDIGGGSTELIMGVNNNIIFNKSFDLGVVSLIDKYNTRNEIELNIRKILSELQGLDPRPNTTYAIAGTPTTLAGIKLQLTKFDEQIIEGTTLSSSDIEHFIDVYSTQPEYYSQHYGKILSGREDLIIPGSLILLTIMNFLDIGSIIVSTRGIRHGIIINYLMNQG